MDFEEAIPAIVGGTGFHLREAGEALGELTEETVRTRWGEAHLTRARLEGRPLVLVDRHRSPEAGSTRLPPHRINYRANIAALKRVGVTGILASTAVGSLRPDWPPGTLVMPDQLLDHTVSRPRTFFDESPVHVDFTEPYCAHLRGHLRSTAREQGISVREGGTYLCTEGPRLESAAEIRMYREWGADLVGMTAAPEAALAREAEISYAGVSVVANPAAGTTPHPLTKAEVLAAMEEAMPVVARLFLAAASAYRDDPSCPARRATEEYDAPAIA